nr:MAG: hypothetical protein CM15mV30_1790 [uncultured marine virus]
MVSEWILQDSLQSWEDYQQDYLHLQSQTGASVADALSRFMTGKDKFSTAIVDNVKELMTNI